MTIAKKISTVATGAVFASSTSAVICYSMFNKSATTQQYEDKLDTPVKFENHVDFSTWLSYKETPDSYLSWF
ncbi:hypothetical protein A6V39_04985 [Candidatus Mycoplasma haematobovis]|uniref:Lipoprotein n=1 Tax=Candidatus Mycoplasma haematobovis TaxID=432608 RepID=A0A1A9QB51_9MOLU|nr:hypothetical protein [Candidatus Mycoplasma haematobovis]OAL09782.1 hypothetical protein A6V39_04985 [Candidatus Mycoplasma haematobovis]